MCICDSLGDCMKQVNPVRTKELTNVRAACKDENVRLTPPRLVSISFCVHFFLGARNISFCVLLYPVTKLFAVDILGMALLIIFPYEKWLKNVHNEGPF